MTVVSATAVCGVVVVADKLDELSNLDKCYLCRSFADALLLALDQKPHPDNVMIRETTELIASKIFRPLACAKLLCPKFSLIQRLYPTSAKSIHRPTYIVQ